MNLLSMRQLFCLFFALCALQLPASESAEENPEWLQKLDKVNQKAYTSYIRLVKSVVKKKEFNHAQVMLTSLTPHKESFNKTNLKSFEKLVKAVNKGKAEWESPKKLLKYKSFLGSKNAVKLRKDVAKKEAKLAKKHQKELFKLIKECEQNNQKEHVEKIYKQTINFYPECLEARSRDFNLNDTRKVHAHYKSHQIKNTYFYSVEGLGHQTPPQAEFEKSLKFLDGEDVSN